MESSESEPGYSKCLWKITEPSPLLPPQGLIWSLRASGDRNPLNVKNRVELLDTGPLPSPLPHGCQPLPLFMQHSRRDFSTPLPICLHCRTTPRPLQNMHFPCIGIVLLCFLVLPVHAFLLFLLRHKVSVGLILGLVPEDVAHLNPSFHPFTCSRGLLGFGLPKTLGYTTVNSSNHWGWGKLF